MKYARFLDPSGSTRVGLLEDGALRAAGRSYAFEDVEVLPPVEPSKIVCIGLNYTDHAEEVGMEIPERPMLFLKPPSALAAHGDVVRLPAGKERIDYEAELGVVIGRQCRNVVAEDAMDYVEGFTCVNDLSNRDDQRVEQNWIRGKAFDNAAPLGPVVATPDEVPNDARVELRLNGERRQSSSRSNLIFDPGELIEEISRYLTLEPGDVISTGTPSGVGALADGDVVEVEVEGIGVLRHRVVVPDA